MKVLFLLCFIVLGASCHSQERSETLNKNQSSLNMSKIDLNENDDRWRALANLHSDHEKWSWLTKHSLEGLSSSMTESDVAEVLKDQMYYTVSWRQMYIKIFPGAMKRFTFEVRELVLWAKYLDQEPQSSRLGLITTPSPAEAREIILLLTAHEFENGSQVLEWINRHPNLNWDKQVGRFVEPTR